MSSLYVFCVQDELRRWLRALGEKWRFDFLHFDSTSQPVLIGASELSIDERTLRVFGFPSSAAHPVEKLNEVKARDWGWIDIRPGGLRATGNDRTLLVSEIHAEDFPEDPVHPARFVQWLKKELRRNHEIEYGVSGKNQVTGGSATYRDLAYSRGAVLMLQGGALWKQDPRDRVLFAPSREPDRTLIGT